MPSTSTSSPTFPITVTPAGIGRTDEPRRKRAPPTPPERATILTLRGPYRRGRGGTGTFRSVSATPDPRRWQALGLICTAVFMTVLDIAIVNVALPSIGGSSHFSADSLQWVITAYAITFGGFLLLGGRAADLLGRRRVFMVGLAIFTGASLACGLARSEAFLIVARGVQGFGAAVVSPAALSIVSTTFEEGAERNKALGIWGAVAGSGAAVGVLLGGVSRPTSAGSGSST